MAEQRLAFVGAGNDAVARVEDLLADGVGDGVVGAGARVGPGYDEPTVGERSDGNGRLARIRRSIDDEFAAVARPEGVEDLATDIAVAFINDDESAIGQCGEAWRVLGMERVGADREYVAE